MFGNTLPPREAYRFARGEQVTSATGQPVRLSRPLDWLVVADHSDGMGLIADLSSSATCFTVTPGTFAIWTASILYSLLYFLLDDMTHLRGHYRPF